MNAAAVLLLLLSGTLGLLAAFAFGVFDEIAEGARAVWGWVSGVSAIVVIGGLGLWQPAPDFMKQAIAHIIRLVPNAPNYLKGGRLRTK